MGEEAGRRGNGETELYQEVEFVGMTTMIINQCELGYVVIAWGTGVPW